MKITVKKTMEVEGFSTIEEVFSYLADYGYELSDKQKKAIEKHGHTYSDKHQFMQFDSVYVEVSE